MKDVKFRVYSFIGIILFLMYCVPSILSGQTYPVDINFKMFPPYSPVFHTLGDGTPGAGKPNQMQLSMLLTDYREPTLNVRLRWEIRASHGTFISNLPGGALFPLVRGVSSVKSNQDLGSYFNPLAFPANMLHDGLFPEGDYQVCVTAIDPTTNAQLSLQRCTYVYFELHEPPVIITPADSINPVTPQSFQVSWQPLHSGIFSVEYKLEIWEQVHGLTPEQIIASKPQHFETRTSATSVFITAIDPPFTPGKYYLARVKVRDIVNGPYGAPVHEFKNYGYSQVQRFKYGYDLEGFECFVPTGLTYQVDDLNDYYISWENGVPPLYIHGLEEGIGAPEPEPLRYQDHEGNWIYDSALHYEVFSRPKNSNGIWSSDITENRWIKFENYKRGRTYEVYLKKVCTSGIQYSDTIEIDIPLFPEEREYQCGLPMTSVNIDSMTLLETLSVDDTIMANDQRIVITALDDQRSPFSGEGFMQAPLIGTVKIAVEFNNIQVNDEYRFVSGEIVTKFDEAGSNVFSFDSLFNFFNTGGSGGVPEYTFLYADSVIYNDGQVFIFINGDTIVYDQPVIIHDSITSYMYSGGYQMELLEGFDMPDELVSGIRMNFSKSPQTIYGFDAYDSRIPDEYEQFDGYNIPYKSVGRGLPDKLIGTLSGSVSIDSVQIVTERGAVLQTEKLNSTQLLIHTAGMYEEEAIMAIIPDGGIGLFYQVAPQLTSYQVNLVEVNGAGSHLNINDLQTAVNEVLLQGVVITEMNRSNIPVTFPGTVVGAESHFMTAYSDDMNSIISSYNAQLSNGLDPVQFYIFLVDNLEGNVSGFMPQGMNCAFVDVTKGDVAKILAHELGHGAFTLRHYWEDYTGNENTDHGNLMDYGQGTNLLFRQWETMHYPRFPVPWIQGDGDGQHNMISGTLYDFAGDTGLNSDSTYTLVTPCGSIIDLPHNSKNVTFFYGYSSNLYDHISVFPGALYSFEDSLFRYTAKIESGAFQGYFNVDYEFDYGQNPVQRETANIFLLASQGHASFINISLDSIPLPMYSGGSMALPDVLNFPLAVNPDDFISSKPIPYNSNVYYFLPSYLDSEILSIIFNANDDEDVNLPMKNVISEIAHTYPYLFKGITDGNDFNNWGQFTEYFTTEKFKKYLADKFYNCDYYLGNYFFDCTLKPGVQPLTKKEYLEEFYEFFYLYVNDELQEHSDILHLIKHDSIQVHDVSRRALINAINVVDYYTLGYDLSPEISYRILSYLADSTLSESDGSEGAVLKLLQTCLSNTYNDHQRQELLQKIEGRSYYPDNNNINSNKYLYERLFYRIDDVGFDIWNSEDNRKALTSMFIQMVYKSSDLESKTLNAYNNLEDRYFVFEYSNVVSKLFLSLDGLVNLFFPSMYSTVFGNVENFVKYDIKYKFESTTGLVKLQQIYKHGFVNLDFFQDSTAIYVKPFDLVFFYNKSNITLVNDLASENSDIFANNYPVPAIAVAYGSEAASDKTAADLLYTTFDIVSLASGAGVLYNVGSTLSKARKAFIYADMFSSATSLAAISTESVDPEVSSFLNVISLLSGIITIPESVYDIGTHRKRVKAGKEIQNNKGGDESLPGKSQISGPLETFQQHMARRMNALIEGLSSGTDITVINKNKESFEQIMRMLIADAYRAGDMDFAEDLAHVFRNYLIVKVFDGDHVENFGGNLKTLKTYFNDDLFFNGFVDELLDNASLYDLVFEVGTNAKRLNIGKSWGFLKASSLGEPISIANVQKLADDILDNPALETFLEGGVGRVKAWEALENNQVFRTNIDYLEYTDEYLIRPGKTKQQFLDDLDAFEDPKYIFLDELKDTPASGLYSNNPSGVWNQNPFIRGNAIEDVANVPGVQTPPTFPKIDYYDAVSQTATSVKSTDLFAKTYQDITKLEDLWKSYVDKISGQIFPISQGDLIIGDIDNPVSNRVLHIVIPHDTPLSGQQTIINTIHDYANSKNVTIIFENIE